MTEQVPGYVTALLFFLGILTVATMAAFAAAVVTWLFGAARTRYYGEEDGEEGGSSGNGGWTDKPGPPPGGGGGNDRDLHEQFHAVADAVGKVIEAEKKQSEGSKVSIR